VNCNEAMLPEIVADRVARGAEYLVNPANDSWLADRRYSEMQLDIVTLRAIEQGRWLVRASTSGPSTTIDPFGRVTARSEPLSRDVILGSVAPRRAITVYGRVGDLFGFACAGAAAIALVAGVWPRLSARRARRGPRASPAPGA
jgi:apolipoprotein N-acyltransferase